MKKIGFIALLLALAAAGFFAGRFSAPPEAVLPVRPVAASQGAAPLPIPPTTRTVAPPAAVPTKPIVIETPAEDAVLSSSFDVAGRVRMDAGPIRVTVVDGAGNIVAEATSAAESDGDAAFGRFTQSFILPASLRGAAVIQAAVSGAAPASDSRRVTFAEPDAVPIRIFFGTTGGNGTDCSAVTAVGRIVSSRGSIYEQALEGLLSGPTKEEASAGYATLLPTGTKLKSVLVDADGVVTADFSSDLDRGVAGSCRVIAIRAQITQTLRQFPEVRDVVIAVDGRTEDILQP